MQNRPSLNELLIQAPLVLIVTLLIMAGVTFGLSAILPPGSTLLAIASGVVTSVGAVWLGIELIDRFWPVSRPKQYTISVDEATYLYGQLDDLAREEELFVALAGDTKIESQFDVYANTFTNETPGPFIREYSEIGQAVQDFRQFVILGEPGAGKTTILRQLATAAIRARLHPTAPPATTIAAIYRADQRVPLPLWITLGFSENPKDANNLLRFWWSKYRLSGSVDGNLVNNDLWIFLDGLNEMPEGRGKRSERAQSLATLLRQYSNIRTIVTCRAHDYDEFLTLNLPIVQLRPLDDTRIKVSVQKRLKSRAGTFLKRLHKQPELENLVRNPYALVMLIDAYRVLTKLPADLNQLYQMHMELRFIDNARRRLVHLPWHFRIREWQFRRRWTNLKEYDLERLLFLPYWIMLERRLRKLAFSMILRIQGTVTDEQWAQKQIGRRALRDGFALSILVVDEPLGGVRFYHHSLHEYFALRDLKKHLERSSSLLRETFIYQIGALGEAGLPAVPALLELLYDPDWNLRDLSVEALKKIGPPAVSYLCKSLRAPEEFVRERAAWALGQIGDSAAIPYLITAIQDPNGDISYRATEALCEMGTESVSSLVELLRHPDHNTRSLAAWALGQIGDSAAIPYLITVLKDPDPDVRDSADHALGQIGHPARYNSSGF